MFKVFANDSSLTGLLACQVGCLKGPISGFPDKASPQGLAKGPVMQAGALGRLEAH